MTRRTGQRRRPARLVAVAGAVLAATALVPAGPAAAIPPAARADRVDPAVLPLGAAPRVAHLVDDTIVDGALQVPATRRGSHDALWKVSGGYVVRDHEVGRRLLTRVVFVDPAGARRVIARSRGLIDVEVSTGGGRIAVARPSGPTGERSVITVQEPASGRVVARREVRLATLVAVTGSRVLLGLRARWHHPRTVWLSVRTGRVRTVVDQAAVAADLGHDRLVLLTPAAGEFCNRVVALSRPRRTLSHSCSTQPRQWSPDGRLALSTWTYFDAAGTNRWWVVDGTTAVPRTRISGRLDWHAVWEDSTHFLVNAQGDAGGAAVVRCDLRGACERATRLWPVPVPSEPSVYYRSPPVVLAQR